MQQFWFFSWRTGNLLSRRREFIAGKFADFNGNSSARRFVKGLDDGDIDKALLAARLRFTVVENAV